MAALRIAIRTDASVEIGGGHVMRCLALAHALRRTGAEICFYTQDAIGNLNSVIASQGFPVSVIKLSDGADSTTEMLDARASIAAIQAAQGRADWLVVDHYGLGATWERSLRIVADQILAIDDIADRSHDCDVLLDQNYVANYQSRYENLVANSCRLLLGPSYCLLREEFSRVSRRDRSEAASVSRVLVSFGGSDPVNLTALFVRAFKQGNYLNISLDVVIGIGNPHRQEIEALCVGLPQVTLHIQSDSMAELMKKADLAFGAGGSTNWERLCSGVPSVIVTTANNQIALAEALANDGYVIYLGRAEDLTELDFQSALGFLTANSRLLNSMARRGEVLVDGHGALRVARTIISSRIDIRCVGMNDCETIFRWRNDWRTRRASLDDAELIYGEHVLWLENAIADPNRLLVIGFCGAEGVGVLRYDVTGSEALVSIYLNPELHGLGYGHRLLMAGERWLHSRRPNVTKLKADVKIDNHASRRCFSRAGFAENTIEYIKEVPLANYVRN
ncbi:MAG: UDP-2,4-diacetamido-2,4,6-trideoxy-beta-L-altropyranose hydrolase [Deltaproteobacteria bacterium]|nr:UDP-2,4-diacetamido-2,4,6-trideoxy-beta-L-altropyranose hydrolase [Deltaproteobacteria bacterium]